MKPSTIFFHLSTSLGLALAQAVPANFTVPPGLTYNELNTAGCRLFTLIFARGTLETGNVGYYVGPPLCTQMKTAWGANNVACQGIGTPYDAIVSDNFLAKGTSDAAIGEASRLITLAKTKCPNTKIIASGYSQGASVIHGSLNSLSAAIKARVFAAVLFGDPRNVIENGQITNYPRNQTRIFCRTGDLVCEGILQVMFVHLEYEHDVDAAINYIRSVT